MAGHATDRQARGDEERWADVNLGGTISEQRDAFSSIIMTVTSASHLLQTLKGRLRSRATRDNNPAV